MHIIPVLASLGFVSCCSAFQLPFVSPPLSPAPPPTHLHSPSASTPYFTLQHAIHLSHHRHAPPLPLDYTPAPAAVSADSGHAQTHSLQLAKRLGQRANDQVYFQAARQASFYSAERAAKLGRFWTAGEMRQMELASALEWEQVEVDVPDISDPGTVGNLARMSSNAYRTPDKPENWYNLTQGWNHVR